MVIFVALASRSLICSNMPFNWSSVTCDTEQQQQQWRLGEACRAAVAEKSTLLHPARPAAAETATAVRLCLLFGHMLQTTNGLLPLPATAHTLLCSAPRCAAARIMFSTLRALSGFTRAMRATAC
jgi:hypothetical protein